MVGHDAPYPHEAERKAFEDLVTSVMGTRCPECQTHLVEIAALRAKIKNLKWRLYGDS